MLGARLLHSIEMKLILVAAVMVVFLFGTGMGFYRESWAFLADLDRQEQTHSRLDALRDLLTALQEAELGLHGFLITERNSYLEPYDRARQEIAESMTALRVAYQQRPDQVGRIHLIATSVADRLADLERTVVERRGRGLEAAQRMVERDSGKRIMDDLHSNVGQLLSMERTSLDYQRQLTQSRGQRAITIWLLLTTASIGGMALSMAQVVKQVRRNRVLTHRLEHDAHHDFLTGLPNRAFFQETLDHTIARTRREGTRCAVLYMDMNAFKSINDQLGHDVGDLVLIEVAHRLQAAVRDADFLARLGGDEFAVLVPKFDVRRELAELVARLEQTVLRISLPILQGRFVCMSVGMATYPDECDSAQALLEAADRAMYATKRCVRPVSDE